MLRGIRGATTVEDTDTSTIHEATTALLGEMVRRNDVTPELIAAAFFTVSPDLTEAFPATAARQMDGWCHVPLLDVQQAPANEDLSGCIRVMLLVNTQRAQKAVEHVYLRRARSLRPDLAQSHGRFPQ